MYSAATKSVKGWKTSYHVMNCQHNSTLGFVWHFHMLYIRLSLLFKFLSKLMQVAYIPSKHLHAQSVNRSIRERCDICSELTLKTKIKVKMFKVNKENSRTRLCFAFFSSVSIGDLEQINVSLIVLVYVVKVLRQRMLWKDM